MDDDARRALEQEFDVLIARAGAVIPAERKAGVMIGYEDLRQMTALLRQPRSAASEPSNVYSLKPKIRGA
ncbi:MAG TPA: hypothetical protein VHN11_10040 [Xanthobacteraceae bacterium]|jgi:hypothetical protein|nr:hypothetical protein [Xanthobacteraceae bacterium]